MKVNPIHYPVENYSERNGKDVIWLCIHTAEGARTVKSLGNYFRNHDDISSHSGCDNDNLANYVNPKHAAWTLRNGNDISDNLELCGFSRWTRKEWFKHTTMLEYCAWWLAERSQARDIPLKKLTPEEVKYGKSGVIGHVDYTYGTGDGNHTDPGKNFPWDYVIDRARRMLGKLHHTESKGLEPMIMNLPRTNENETREEIMNLGYIGGWHGRCIVRFSMGHPGGTIEYAHVEYPETSDNEDLMKGVSVEPIWNATTAHTHEIQGTGPGTLMVKYTALGGLSVNVEREH